MKREILENGVRLIYKYKESYGTSFSIALEAGANAETESFKNYNLGVAHALEHMTFKAIDDANEEKINKDLDRLFGFNNAMTNFPYVIYYGTCSDEDFEEAISLYGKIVLKPSLNEEGFKEEMNVIKIEAKEWGEDFDQLCEDELLFNAFKKRRISEIIIGNQNTIDKITMDEIRDFYNNFYVSQNIVVSVVSSKDFETVKKVVNEIFIVSKKSEKVNFPIKVEREDIKSGIYTKSVSGLSGGKIMFAYDISGLSQSEIEGLKIFNLWFGEGVSSKLYENIRTKEGLAYDVASYLKNEKGIKLFVIYASVEKKDIEKTLELINKTIKESIKSFGEIQIEELLILKKRLKLIRALEIERSIVLSNRMATYELMYDNKNLLEEELLGNISIDKEIICNALYKTFKNEAIQILK